MLTDSTLVVVADGAVARFLNRARLGARLVELIDKRMQIDLVERERDRPARTHDRVGAGRHAMERRLKTQDAAEQAFLTGVAGQALEILGSAEVSTLILCAPPRALGVLRGALSSEAREKLTLSWGKDITRETPSEIDARLRDLKV